MSSVPGLERSPGGGHSKPCSCMHAQSFIRVWLFATPWTEALQVLLSLGFSRQGYWSGMSFPTPIYMCVCVCVCMCTCIYKYTCLVCWHDRTFWDPWMKSITLKYVQRIVRKSYQDRQFFRCEACYLKWNVGRIDVSRYWVCKWY